MRQNLTFWQFKWIKFTVWTFRWQIECSCSSKDFFNCFVYSLSRQEKDVRLYILCSFFKIPSLALTFKPWAVDMFQVLSVPNPPIFFFLLNPPIDTEKGLSHKLIGSNLHLDPREPCSIPRIEKNNDHFLSHKRLASLCHLSIPAFSRFSTCSLQSAKNRVSYEWQTYS